MVKLVPAKCPNCGANLELDDNLKKTECKYCRTTIVVDEAIQKYQVELTGKVKVSGIQDDDDELEIIKKYIIVGDYKSAHDRIKKLLEKNPFNLKVHETFLNLWIIVVETSYENKIGTKTKILEITVDDYQLLKEIALTPFDKFFESLNIINKLNDGNIEDEIIKEMERVANHLKLLIQENEQVKEIKERLISKCNNYLKQYETPNKKIKGTVKLLNSLLFDEGKYGEDYNFVPFSSSKYIDYNGDERIKTSSFDPVVIDIGLNYIDFDFGKLIVKKYKGYNFNTEVGIVSSNKNSDVVTRLTRTNKICWEEQEKIIDELPKIKDGFLGKLFGK